MHWFVAGVGAAGAWLCRDDARRWSGWDAASGGAVDADLPADFTPWTQGFDGSQAPHWRWFVGGRTNACFSEVDRHVLAGHGDETALIFEGDRWDMSANDGKGAPLDCFAVSRKQLLLETAKCALALEALGLKAGDRIALNMPSILPQIYWIEAAKRLGIVYTSVFGGFSDKTLSDRICDAGARVIVTSDGSYRNAQVAAFKNAYTDPALDNYVPVATALALLSESDLGLPEADTATILDAVRETLAGEVTVERSDVMRGVGRALLTLGKEGRISPTDAARVRIAIASRLVSLPPRVEAVIVVRHTAQPDVIWREERDRWSHELTDAALHTLLAGARDAGIAVTTQAELLALPDAEFVRAIWASSRPLPGRCRLSDVPDLHLGIDGQAEGDRPRAWLCAGVAHTMAVSFDARAGDTIFVVADPGWITGQSYLICAPLMTRVTSVISEGSPVFPHAGRFASMIERHGVTIFKAGVTFLKSVMADPSNLADLERYDMGALRVATFCAEPTVAVGAGVRDAACRAALHQQLLGDGARRHRLDAFPRQRRLPATAGRARLSAAVDSRRGVGRGPRRHREQRAVRAGIPARVWRGGGRNRARRARSSSPRLIPISRGPCGATSPISASRTVACRAAGAAMRRAGPTAIGRVGAAPGPTRRATSRSRTTTARSRSMGAATTSSTYLAIVSAPRRSRARCCATRRSIRTRRSATCWWSARRTARRG
jgi:acrylyl-CoA reductase (NADPH)/3-hydroxypropionyl-CoA dehydratase/3-hydroxypropionyl-CoA synthetase